MTHHEQSRHVEFGTDGIRGIAGEFPLDHDTLTRVGYVLGQRAAQSEARRVIVGTDTRISALPILGALVDGLVRSDIEVFNIGVMTTPGVAFLTREYGAYLGIIISASHNPYEQNGIKLVSHTGYKFGEAEEAQLQDAINTVVNTGINGSPRLPNTWLGTFRDWSEQGTADYMLHLVKNFEPLDNLRVVLDCANGAAYRIAPMVFTLAKANLMTLNNDPDGLNINVEAGSEHVRRDRSTLHTAIREHAADLGIAFDGDADRVVFVTPEGMLIDGDHILGILALEFQKRGMLTDNTVVATDMSNSGLEHFLKEQGITLHRTKVGDKYVMDALQNRELLLGGEQAGHIIIRDAEHTLGDGVYVGLLVAEWVSRNKREGGTTLHKLASRIPRYPQVIASAHLHNRVDLKSVEGLDALQKETLALFGGMGRVNVRFSGTEPNLLRAMIEGGAETSMAQVIERALAICNLVAQATNTPNPRIDVVDCVTGAPVSL
jgi:phosphoglucosamine mutase